MRNFLLVLGFLLLTEGVTQAKMQMTYAWSASQGEGSSVAPAGMVTRTGDKYTQIKIHNSCYGTNLRNGANPVAPSAIISANFDLDLGGKTHNIDIKYPGHVTSDQGMVSLNEADNSPNKIDPGLLKTDLPDAEAGIFGNVVYIKTKLLASLTVHSDGKISSAQTQISSPEFFQEVTGCGGPAVYGPYGYSKFTPTYACGKYMGKTGRLTASISAINISKDESMIDIYVAFPGQTGFCGGYFSPLMVFFDEERPRFTHQSSFPLNPTGKTAWPEANSPGWFLAYDKNSDGKIAEHDQLFGNNIDIRNGFDALKKLDSNKDGFISAQDKEFKKLVLWRDINGDGISQKDELIPLAKVIRKISLKYQSGVVRPIGKYAEERETAIAWTVASPSKRSKRITIADIWLSPAPAPQLANNIK